MHDQKPKPNLIFSAEALQKGYQPVPHYRNLRQKIKMPSTEEQIKGFFHEQPELIINLSGGLIKRFEEKEQLQTDLTEAFPGREVFRKKGLNLADVLQLVEENKLAEVEGIGVKTVEKILEHLAANNLMEDKN